MKPLKTDFCLSKAGYSRRRKLTPAFAETTPRYGGNHPPLVESIPHFDSVHSAAFNCLLNYPV